MGRAFLCCSDPSLVQSPHLRPFPIYYASQLARKALTVYSMYITYMNAAIRQAALTRNPFEFRFVRNLAEGSQLLAEPHPCVVMASPGMLQSGFSRQLLEAWCEDSRNAVLLTGYSVEGTMAKLLQTDPTHIDSKSGGRLARRCRIEAVSFSAHCDFLQTSEFVDLVKPNHIVLVHGEKNQMARLQDALLRKYNQAEQAANKRRQLLAAGAAAAQLDAGGPLAPLWRPQAIHSPENCVSVEVAFPQQGKVRVALLAELGLFSFLLRCGCWERWPRWCRALGGPCAACSCGATLKPRC